MPRHRPPRHRTATSLPPAQVILRLMAEAQAFASSDAATLADFLQSLGPGARQVWQPPSVPASCDAD